MAFESLLNKPMTEQELIGAIITEIRANYSTYQDKNIFLKLNKTGDKTSEIIWMKNFSDIYKLMDFYFDTKFERTCIMIKYIEKRYELLCRGHFICDRFGILADKILNSRPFEVTRDPEQSLAVPREILEDAFKEMEQLVSTRKRNKAI